MRVAVAGCGRMGFGMCRALADAGFDARGFDVRPVADFGDFAPNMLPNAAALKAHAEVLFTVVRDVAQTDALLFDDQAVLSGESAVKVLVISSTLSPSSSPSVLRFISFMKAIMPPLTPPLSPLFIGPEGAP